MITVSLCMIVKNEERVLARCLDTVKDIADEIIIVDTGSSDRTKQIAAEYTDKIYDFKWTQDFSAARNYAFSKAEMDYIYSADADEVLDAENRERFLQLKEILLPEVEIVQMKYTNQLQFGTTYNYNTEYRPKLYKRLRTFRWIDPVHEMVDTKSIIYDSEIEIIHMPEQNHAGRDFEIFFRVLRQNGKLSGRLVTMFAKELYISGRKEDFIEAYPYFFSMLEEDCYQKDELHRILCILAAGARRAGQIEAFFTNCMKAAVDSPCSELCYELGEYYKEAGNYKEAILWYYNAVNETESILNIHYAGDYPLQRLAECSLAIGEEEQAAAYSEQVLQWTNNYNHML